MINTESGEMVEAFKWGFIIRFQHNNMWGEPCQNIFDYIFTGKFGSYPKYKYRFTQIGDGSVGRDDFNDLFLDGAKSFQGRILKSWRNHSEWKGGDYE